VNRANAIDSRRIASVLVIDDEAIVRESCLQALSDEGHQVSVAANGPTALDLLERGSFDVAFLDLRMPGSGGLTLLHEIHKVSPQTDVVVITGYPSVDNAKESIRLGAFDFMIKPFTPSTLCAVVSQALACRPWKVHERC
jgi:DNA-binding NtrC family response regulator